MARRGLSGSRGRGKEEEGGEARARRWRRMMRRGGGKGGEKDKGFLGRNALVYVSSHPCRYNSAANVNVLFPKKRKAFPRKESGDTRRGSAKKFNTMEISVQGIWKGGMEGRTSTRDVLMYRATLGLD